MRKEREFERIYGGKLLCVYCGGMPTTLDHVVPLSKGGRNHVGNYVPACSLCNSSKGSNSYDEFRDFCDFIHLQGHSLSGMSRGQRKEMKREFFEKTGILIGAV